MTQKLATEIVIVSFFIFGMALTTLGAYQIHEGLGVLMSGAWFLLIAVAGVSTHRDSIRRGRYDEEE